MPDLDEQLARYIDATATPITLDEVTRPVDGGRSSTSEGKLRTQRPWWLSLAAVAAAVIALAGVVALQDEPTPEDRIVTGEPDLDGGREAFLADLAPFGEEAPQPAVPEDWKVVDDGTVRFAVPAGWPVTDSPTCGAAPTDGVVAVIITPIGGNCSPEQPLPPSVATVDDGNVSVTGPDAAAVLATITDPGSRRALQDGPIADTSGWRDVNYGGVAFVVPADWAVEDLPASYTEVTRSDGGRLISGLPDPGACGSAMFPTEGTPQVSLGQSLVYLSCPRPVGLNLAPGDGAWIREVDAAAAGTLGTVVVATRIDELEVEVVDIDPTQRPTPQPVIDVVLRHGTDTTWLTIGVGLDPTTARTILRSLRSA